MTRKFRNAINNNKLFKKEPTVNGLKNRMNLVITLWIVDKIFMLIMFIFVFEVGRIGSAIHDFITGLF